MNPLELVLGMIAKAKTRDELRLAVPLAGALDAEAKDTARWSYAYAQAQIKERRP